MIVDYTELMEGSPRAALTDTETTPCPWCGTSLGDTEYWAKYDSNNGPGPFNCHVCKKDFIFDVNLNDGAVFTVGLKTKADLEYEKQRGG